jgi:VacB/RNase II family 3'-5' exoribonuclease
MNTLTSIAHRIMVERGLLPDFSPAVLAETSAIKEVSAAVSPVIHDLRGLLWASIDNDSSRDLDQLTVAEPLTHGAVKVYVAISDVDAAVRRHCAIDDHAQTNTTSVYTAAGIFPMLPERLSTDLTSLGEGQDRLAIVAEITVDAEGAVKDANVFRAAVHNHAKLAYDSVAAWLDGSAPTPTRIARIPGLYAQLRIQDQVAQAMRRRRCERGALTLQTPQAEAVFDGDELSDLRPGEPNRAKELIEDFMVAANGAIARYLAAK